jgi:hypothetical protein
VLHGSNSTEHHRSRGAVPQTQRRATEIDVSISQMLMIECNGRTSRRNAMNNVVQLPIQTKAIVGSILRLGAEMERRAADQVLEAITSHAAELDVIALKYLAAVDVLPNSCEKIQVLRNIVELRQLISKLSSIPSSTTLG